MEKMDMNKLKEQVLEGLEEREHILIVDDNAMVLRNIKQMIQEKYSVAVATSGSQCFTQIGKKKPDLILLDYQMPIMDGKMVLEMLQQDEETKQIPVVFLTSESDRDVVSEILRLKPAGYLLKTPAKDRLMETIQHALEQESK